MNIKLYCIQSDIFTTPDSQITLTVDDSHHFTKCTGEQIDLIIINIALEFELSA